MEAPNTLNVSYLQNAPGQLSSNQRWYKNDLSRAENKTVRLLYLEPGQRHDAVAGRLVCHAVSQKPRYDALSYSWGEQNDWTEITLDGMPGFWVTHSLWLALRRLRSTAVVRLIWIDAICINQSNVAERNQQVAAMDSTFGNARTVLIWLGDCSDGKYDDLDPRLVGRILTRLERKTPDATKAWWNRLWVVQEVALAKELMVYFGPHVLTWADFFMSAESRLSFKGVVNLRTVRAFVQSHGFARKDEVSLEELLVLTGNLYASDPLDYVFGLLGLVPGQERLRDHNLSPDYTLTPFELFTRLNGYLESDGDKLAGGLMLHKILNRTASLGHSQLTKLLLDSDQIDLGMQGPSALCYAAEHGRVPMLKMLLEDYNLDANSRDGLGRTPLVWAAARAQTDAVELLLHQHHIDPNARDALGRDALSWAAACTSVTGSDGAPSIQACLNTLRLLLARSKVDPDSQDAKGRTPLAWAVYAGSLPVVELLLETGRTNPLRRFDGQPLVAWAFEFRHSSIAELLIRRGIPDWRIMDQFEWDWERQRPGQGSRFDRAFWLVSLHDVGEASERATGYGCQA